MKVFISWSGIRSRYVAESLRGWLPRVLQAVRPWMSNEDIAIGTRWLGEVTEELSSSNVGIICITPENQHSPWIMFESGALSKIVPQSYVCPYLFDLTPAQLSGPLTQFQASTADREGTYRILQTLNKALGSSQLPVDELDEIFEVWWPRFESKLIDSPKFDASTLVQRTPEDILDELLNNSREHLRRENLRLEHHGNMEQKFNDMFEMFGKSIGDVTKLLEFTGEKVGQAKKKKSMVSGPTDALPFSPVETVAGVQEMFDVLRLVARQHKDVTEKLLNPPVESDELDELDGKGAEETA